MSERRFIKTLKGMGPQITAPQVGEQAPLVAYERELARFDWIASGIQQRGRATPVHQWVAVITQTERSPGGLERAIVGLAMSKNVLAQLALAGFEPPQDLELLHRIAVIRSG